MLFYLSWDSISQKTGFPQRLSVYLNFHYCFTSLIWTEGDEGSLTSIKKLQETMLSVLNSPAIPPNIFNYGSLQRMLQNPGENSCYALTGARRERNPLPMTDGLRIIHHHDSACPWHLHGVCQRCWRTRTQGISWTMWKTWSTSQLCSLAGDIIAQCRAPEINYKDNLNKREVAKSPQSCSTGDRKNHRILWAGSNL